MIFDILIIIAWLYVAASIAGAPFGLPALVRKLPPVKRRMIAGERRKRERLMLRDIEREEETRRNAALRALTVADVAFLSAGGHWTPPESVRERMRQEEFVRNEHARQLREAERAAVRRNLEQRRRAALEAVGADPSEIRRQINELRSVERGSLTAREIADRHAVRQTQAIREAGQKLRAIGMSYADVDALQERGNAYRPTPKPHLRAETIDGLKISYEKLGEVIDTDIIESADGTRFEIRRHASGAVTRRDLPPLYRHMM